MTDLATPPAAARSSTPRVLRLHADDNVIVAIDTIMPGGVAEGVTASERIPKGHKMAVRGIPEGGPVLKFGQIIGFAKAGIAPGAWIHEHNCGMHDFDRDYRFAEGARDDGLVPEAERRTFEGYRRSNGKVGTRNYIGILTSVNCSATVARFIAEQFNTRGLLDAFPNVDGVVSFVHGTGCGMGGSGEGYETLERTQWGYANHPNLAGVLVVGLGCEVFQIPRLVKQYGLSEHEGFRTMTIQETGGTRKTVEHGIAMIKEMLPAANAARRTSIPVAEIKLGLQCGGSDGYSGITANPALGHASDLLVREGATTVLSETPEIYGAEHLLTRRAADRAVGEKLVDLIKWWEDYTERNQGEMNNNPSPGNKAGGLTTILEKSLGAAAKGGTATLRGVYKYAEPITTHGFVYMDSPGYDPASVTGQIASGCNMIAFTTGRGSAAGYKPTPSIKLATNSDLYARMTEDMDVNCGDILDGVSIEAKGREIFEKIIAVASGEKSKSEALGYGDAEFVPWQIGAVM
ncbi:UxaA family hydrolase [Prosthecomicrobium pneumaticum]|uniref:Altronate hydrolase n=1 Tax=Prosthecomicrobium pneumaticum TaxID=81895 RepID=A0A7W9FMX4_9HYPH|nr:altronate dehydratase family protein [Prosthecomicrobium pneumaticum]MBB5753586.1 altronate hydrolase [Prosthecomicrobium pneumaticum]